MEKHELIDIVGRGSKVRKNINSHLIIGENTPEYNKGDILDANATAAKIQEVKTYLKDYVDNNHKTTSDEWFYEKRGGENLLLYKDPDSGNTYYVEDTNGNAVVVTDPENFTLDTSSTVDTTGYTSISATTDGEYYTFDAFEQNAITVSGTITDPTVNVLPDPESPDPNEPRTGISWIDYMDTDSEYQQKTFNSLEVTVQRFWNDNEGFVLYITDEVDDIYLYDHTSTNYYGDLTGKVYKSGNTFYKVTLNDSMDQAMVEIPAPGVNVEVTLPNNETSTLPIHGAMVADINNPDKYEDVTAAKNVTYAELKDLRDSGKLISGMLYRITDFTTTVDRYLSPWAMSAGHPFDVIVRADSANTLNEQAWAAHHAGDSYFANSRLEAWELRYRLDNVAWSAKKGTYIVDSNDWVYFSDGSTVEVDGTTYYLLQVSEEFEEDWGDNYKAVCESLEQDATIYAYYNGAIEEEAAGTISTVSVSEQGGTGVIMWMKDEFGNECPYDFKNVKFARYQATSDNSGLNGKYLCVENHTSAGITIAPDALDCWSYTFSSDASSRTQTDISLDGINNEVYLNVFKRGNKDVLPNNVLYGVGSHNNVFGSECRYNTSVAHFYSNTFGDSCRINTFSYNCYYNTFGDNCSGNSFGDNFKDNTFGCDCEANIFGNTCSGNTFSNTCSNNTFSTTCSNNTFSNSCTGNTFGIGCNSNTFGVNCSGNTFGDNCQNNTFGNSCPNNTFGNYCSANSFGNYCSENTFNNACSGNTFGSSCVGSILGSGFKGNSLGNGCIYLNIADNVKNAHVLNGTGGTDASRLTIGFSVSADYAQYAGKTSNGVLAIWTPADTAPNPL